MSVRAMMRTVINIYNFILNITKVKCKMTQQRSNLKGHPTLEIKIQSFNSKKFRRFSYKFAIFHEESCKITLILDIFMLDSSSMRIEAFKMQPSVINSNAYNIPDI